MANQVAHSGAVDSTDDSRTGIDGSDSRATGDRVCAIVGAV